jgi:hypothetical protein
MIVLVCEWCPKTPVVRWRLSRGAKTKDDVLLDFCAGDNRKFMKLIQPRQRQKAGVPHAVSTRKMSTAKELKELNNKVLHLVPKSEWVAPLKIKTDLKEKPWRITKALQTLLKDGQVERQGRNRSAKYRRK